MSAKFTPGPWKVDYQDRRGGNIIAPSGPVASTRWFGVTHKQVMEDYANADLIAAAPELYEALQTWGRWCGHLTLPQEAVEQTRAVLAKARGER